MKEYKTFVNLLESELESFLIKPKDSWKETALKYVDGFAAKELRRLVDLETRRKHGAFFTHSELGKKVLSLLKPNFTNNSIVYDPACGASNLLISMADFARKKGYSKFEKNLRGTDINVEFIEASRLRLQMNQLIYANDISKKEIFEKNILKADGLLANEFYKQATHIVVNPPFNQIPSDNQLNWAKGKVSAAAIFIDKIIQHSKPGVSILAILPDVLRSGTRYEKWRSMIDETCIIEEVELLGQFDQYADVDVFALKLKKRNKTVTVKYNSQKWVSNKITSKTLSNLFDISVGPVVDYRDPHNGIRLKYIVSKELEGWKDLNDVKLTRSHGGKSFDSPFVVVKRTSRMGDKHRAVATIINICDPVYVDNHLIILKPKSGKISDCKKIQKLLKDKKTNNWINDQIRCRHLTVKVIAKIPVWQ